MKNGVVAALLGYAVYSWGDGLIKSLGGTVSVFEMGFFNTVFAGCFLFFLKPAGEHWRGFWNMERPFAVHMRAIIAVVAGMLGVFAFTNIPMAEVYAIVFLAPLFVTLLAMVVLGEQVGPCRWAAVVAGFVGILLVVKPGFRELELGHFAALIVAFLAAVMVILMRSLAREKQTSMLGAVIVYGLVLNGIAALVTSGVSMPEWRTLAVLVAIGACTAGGHRLQLLSTRLSPANLIAPTHYSQMIWAVLIGAIFFAEYPDWISIVGLVIIAASGLLTLMREQVRFGKIRWPWRARL